MTYRYKTVFRGKGLSITIASGGEDYRRIIRTILPLLSVHVLDNRSMELRDHLADPKLALWKAEASRIPSADVLESTFKNRRARSAGHHPGDADLGPADELRHLANELRLSGYLPQALEAFRRVFRRQPADARLLFEFARCLHSFAGSIRDPALERRALAALRLSERRAADDADLLARLGEWYFQIGEWRRAGNVYQNALDRLGENFRTARGLAELALREGKIAHVIHQFSAAHRLAETPALKRWSRAEAEYFSHLNTDDEYMELEIGRVNMLETVESLRRSALRVSSLGFPAILIGVLFEDHLTANVGWAVSAVALTVWAGLIIMARALARRIPYDMMESDE